MAKTLKTKFSASRNSPVLETSLAENLIIKKFLTFAIEDVEFQIFMVKKANLPREKLEEKIYDNYTGYPGGRREEVAKDLQRRRPEVIIERAVKGMLPKNRLGRKVYKKLYIYAGSEHPHTAQKAQELKF